MQRTAMDGITLDSRLLQGSSHDQEIGVLDELRIGWQRIRETRFSWWDD